MGAAAIYFHPDGFDTSTDRLLGRHSAGESFLRGLIRYGSSPRLDLWNATGGDEAKLGQLIRRIEPTDRPTRWVAREARAQLSDPGVLHLPTPSLPQEAWRRLAFGARRYAISGITHTTASANVMGLLPNFLIAPLEDHDALICTSNAVRAAVETQIDMMRDYMRGEYGPRRRPEAQRVTIPLGVNCSDFGASDEHRRAWREKLGIPAEAFVALYVGRFNVKAKMNPALMALALERAAKRIDAPIYWVNSGWAENAAAETAYEEETRKLCPSVAFVRVDGRAPDVRFSIWSVADMFISFSDNIQESFGLTPVEAMAAGLPSVVSDWDGYRDTVRDGLDGFSIPTIAPRGGLGGDLAYWYENDWLSYANYIGAVGQYTAVDLRAAEQAIVDLASNPDLRARMGREAQAQARRVFDWSVIVPQYEALWGEQNARRLAAGALPSPQANPYAPDPFTLFASYPTRPLSQDDVVTLSDGMTWDLAKAQLAAPFASYGGFNRPRPQELEHMVDRLHELGPATVATLRALFEPARRPFIERGLIWLARFNVVEIDQPPS